MEIVEQLPCEIKYVCHAHISEIEFTLIACSEANIHLYDEKQDGKLLPFSRKLSCIPLDLIKANGLGSFKELENIAKKFELLDGLCCVGDFFVGWCSQAIILFKSELKNNQFSFQSDLLTYALKKIEASNTILCQIQFVKLVSTAPGSSHVQVSKETFISLFGLNTFNCGLKIILIFLKSGQIWYESIESFTKVHFLYSVGEECIDASSNRINKRLNVTTKSGKTLEFYPKLESFDVRTTFWAKKSVVNICLNGLENCTGNLCAFRSHVCLNKVHRCQDKTESDLQHILKCIEECELRRNVLKEINQQKDTLLQNISTLAKISVEGSKCFSMEFSSGLLHLKLQELIPFSSFTAICKRSKSSKTYTTTDREIYINFLDLINASSVFCVIKYGDLIVNLGEHSFCILDMFRPAETPMSTNWCASFQLNFHASFVTIHGDIIEYLFSNEISLLKKPIVLGVVEERVSIELVEKNDLIVLQLKSTSKKISMMVHSSILAKLIKSVTENHVSQYPHKNKIVFC